MFSQDDDSHGWILGVVFGIVALVIALSIGVGIYQKNLKAKSATTSVAVSAINTTATADSSTANAGTTAGMTAAAGSAAAGATAVVSDAAMANAAQTAADAASVKVENGVVKFYFASGKTAVAVGGNEALADVVKAVASGKKAFISGFNDPTGDATKNAELSKQRAFAVRDALKALGVADDKIELKKPENTNAAGSNAEARRVEVSVQ
jgi:outer membrane protein OmpA-like peptidoglycan-associated protein